MLVPCPFRKKRSWALSERSLMTVSSPRVPRYKQKCLHFVASVDADPKNLHDVMFYAIVARADYAVPHMRSLTGDGIKVGASTF